MQPLARIAWIWTVRLAALALCLLSAHQAWAGLYFYKGMRAADQNAWQEARSYLQQSIRIDPIYPNARYELGKVFWNQYAESAQVPAAAEAVQVLSDLSSTLPLNGKAALYLALSRLAVMDGAAGPEEAEKHWEKALNDLKRAVRLGGKNPWIASMAGKAMLLHEDYLSEDDRKTAIWLLYRGIQTHLTNVDAPYLDQAPPHLKPILEFLWSRYRDIHLLRDITPMNRASYKVLLEVMTAHAIAGPYGEVYRAYADLAEADYKAACSKGEALLSEGRYEAAKAEFRKAFWMQSWQRPIAKAGILAAEQALGQLRIGKHEIFRDELGKVLGHILETEDEDLGGLLPYLKGAVEIADEDFLRGLYALWTGDGEQAAGYLETSADQSPHGRRYLAQAYHKAGRPAQAVSYLTPAYHKEHADAREIYLLQEWDGIPDSWVREKLDQILTRNQSSRFWWNGPERSNRLNGPGKRVMELNLMPGNVELTVYLRMKSAEENQSALVRFSLGGKVLGAAAVRGGTWTAYRFPLTSAGGKRWLEAEWLGSMGSAEGPEAELGPVKAAVL